MTRPALLLALLLGACKGSTSAPDAATTTGATATTTTPPTTTADATAAPDDATAAPAGLFPDEPFRATRPTPKPVADLKLPEVERFTLPSGLEVFLVADTRLPTVQLTFELDTGAVDDPDDKLGLASVCLDLFSEGTERLDKIALAEKLADHAVAIYSPAGGETSTIVVRALEAELGPALELLGELVATPGLRQEDFARIIADRKAALKQQRGSPSAIAQRLFPSLVWGADHPYARVQVEAHLDAITLDDCRAFVARIKPEGARLWVAGKVTRARLEDELGKRLASWSGKAPAARAIPAAKPTRGAIHVVQVDGAVQSMVLVGHPGPQRSAEDYEATHLMAQILGGSFSSRINMNLREAKGYAYGGSGRFSYRRAGSALAVGASVEGSTTALALREIVKEIDGMRSGEPTTDELARERDGALLALPASFATASDTLGELRTLVFFGLPLDWFAGYQARLRAVDAAAVKQAAAAHLETKDVVVLVVGDVTKPAKDSQATVLAELQKLADEKLFGAGGLVFLDPDGKPTEPPGAR
ncbi:MAG: insulinase family protein [Deltaproteobacteria bacterium]|nr:insulinase family protein [Deltaproteobacteria bacterium]